MKKLKIVLESKIFLFFVIVISFFICLIKYNMDIPSLSEKLIIKNIDKTKCKIIASNVIINYYGECTFDIGDEIEIDKEVKIPSVNTNFNLFNYNLYLKSKGIYYTVTPSNITIIKKTNNIHSTIIGFL